MNEYEDIPISEVLCWDVDWQDVEKAQANWF